MKDIVNPRVGEKIKVEVKHTSNLLPKLYPKAPKSVVYEGQVLRSEDYDPPGTIRITGEGDMPLRVILINRILKWNGVKTDFKPSKTTIASPKVKEPKERFVIVKGSKGNKYKVTIDARGNKTCTCTGFGYRRTCRHINEVK